MPRINLLPTSATRRVDNARNELVLGGLLLVMLFIVIQAWQKHDSNNIAYAQTQLTNLEEEITSLSKKVTEADELKKKQHDLESRLKVIGALQERRGGPAKLLGTLADIMTGQPKIWLTLIDQHENELKLEGGAMEHENISDLQAALLAEHNLFRQVLLGGVSTNKEVATHALTWVMNCTPAARVSP